MGKFTGILRCSPDCTVVPERAPLSRSRDDLVNVGKEYRHQ